MTYGDDAGLMLPPKIAPIQVVLIPIWKKADEKGVIAAANNLNEMLKEAGIRVKLDDMDQRTPGWKFNFREMKLKPYSFIEKEASHVEGFSPELALATSHVEGERNLKRNC